jgi:hypothetical protein
LNDRFLWVVFVLLPGAEREIENLGGTVNVVVVVEVVVDEEVEEVEVVVVVVDEGEAHALISVMTSLSVASRRVHWLIKETTSYKATVPQGSLSPTKLQFPKILTKSLEESS